MGDWEIDRINPLIDPAKPDWSVQKAPVELSDPLDPMSAMIPAQLTGNGGKLTFTVSKTHIGSYSYRIKYWSVVNSAKVEGAFVVDVYPETDYTHPAPTT